MWRSRPLPGQAEPPALLRSWGLFVLALALTLGAQAEPLLPPQLAGVGVVEQLGRKVDLGLTFVNSDGRVVKLGDFFHAGRPVILNLVYYSCPMLCTLVLNGQTSAMGKIPWTPGQEYEVVTISIDPTETSELARQKRAGYIEQLGRGGAGWHFLTDLDGHVKTLADQVGFHYKYDEQIKQYAHQAAIMILTPGGAVSRYLYGIDFRPRDVRLALTEASEGKFSLSVDRLLLFCYHYDPAARSYVPFAANVMRAGGVVAVLMLAVFLGVLWRQERRAA
jgi:protein SCO1